MAFPGPAPKLNRSQVDFSSIDALPIRIEEGYVFEVVITLSTANAGGVSYGFFKTGSKACLISYRAITTNGNEIIYQPFRAPTITGDGTEITSSVVNINGNNAKDSTATIFQGGTVSDPGSPIPRTYMPGAESVGNIGLGSFSDESFERHLSPNTDYAVRITNNGAKNPATTDILLVWYEYDNSKVTWR